MNQLGEPLAEGKYLLNETIVVAIERRKDKLCIHMGGNSFVEITTSVDMSSKWKVWYLLDKRETTGTLQRVSK